MLGFRVWDSENKRFIDTKDSNFTMNGSGEFGRVLTHQNILYFNCTPSLKNAFIPLQSTGIKDWQDKPIYEGDMIFIHYHEKSLTNEYYLVNTVREFLLFYGARMLSIYKIANDGNVYEQPTLLEKLK